MGSQTLSSVLEKHLHSLCLNSFPCGHGSWSKTKAGRFEEQSWGYTEQDNSREGADKEDQGALIDLLTCPHSPWQHKGSWSPRAPALRELSVQSPQRLHVNSISKHFSTLRIVDKDVSVIDDSLLKFSNLEELVLSVNKISELHAGHLPCSLRVLELHANRLSSLNSLSHHQLPHLQHLGLGLNSLGSQEDIQYLTGVLWPKLVSLDLSWCEFQEQQALVNALTTLPCLRTLVLEGNPLTLAPSYPGFTIDSLPRLFYLDASRITQEDRYRFRGLAKMSELIGEHAAATVSVHRIRGIPNPERDQSEFPTVTYSYCVTYDFLSHQAAVNKVSYPFNTSSLSKEIKVLIHSTSKLAWAECMDFIHTSSYVVDDLSSLKRFFIGGLWLRIEEEKVLSWPAPPEETPVAKPTQPPKAKKGGKGKESPSKAGSRDKSRDKKKSVTDLVQDTPIRRILGSVHVPLQSLVKGSQKVDTLCDLGFPLTEPSLRAMGPLEKDPAKKIKDDKKSQKKSGGNSAIGQRNAATSKGKGKGQKESETVYIDETAPIQQQPMTVEFSVQLEKWQSASEAHQLLLP
ncbi:leucine-rich repeat-containing protein 43-like [Polymixia lowei]